VLDALRRRPARNRLISYASVEGTAAEALEIPPPFFKIFYAKKFGEA